MISFIRKSFRFIRSLDTTQWLALLGIVSGGFLLVVLITGVVEEVILRPLLYFIWRFLVVINSFPQEAIWAIMIGFSVLLAFRSFGQELFIKPPEIPLEFDQRTRLETLINQLEETRKGRYFRHRMLRHLVRLLIESEGLASSLPEHTLEQLLAENQLELSEDVATYLSKQLNSESLFGMKTRNSGLLNRLLRPKSSTQSLLNTPEFEAIIHHLETQLEIFYDDGTF